MTQYSAIVIPLAIWIALVSPSSVNSESEVSGEIIPGKWEMVRNTDGVQTYFRWLTKDDGTPFRERKGEILVNCALQEAVRLISDAESTKKWMSGITENYYIKRINQNEWYNYTLFSIPWPFSKRDLVSLYKVISDPVHGTVTVTITCKDKYVPLKPGITRLTDYRATWIFTKRGEKSTHINFSMSSMDPPAFPRAIQDPVIEKMFHKNLIRLKEMLLAIK